MSPKKRKEQSSPIVQLPLGHCDVPVNPSEEHPPNKATALSIPQESFSLSNGNQSKSYSLLVKVHQNSTAQVLILLHFGAPQSYVELSSNIFLEAIE